LQHARIVRGGRTASGRWAIDVADQLEGIGVEHAGDIQDLDEVQSAFATAVSLVIAAAVVLLLILFGWSFLTTAPQLVGNRWAGEFSLGSQVGVPRVRDGLR
jgi:hypothetical protein